MLHCGKDWEYVTMKNICKKYEENKKIITNLKNIRLTDVK